MTGVAVGVSPGFGRSVGRYSPQASGADSLSEQAGFEPSVPPLENPRSDARRGFPEPPARFQHSRELTPQPLLVGDVHGDSIRPDVIEGAHSATAFGREVARRAAETATEIEHDMPGCMRARSACSRVATIPRLCSWLNGHRSRWLGLSGSTTAAHSTFSLTLDGS